jgi:hypothetical protein
MSWLIDHGGSEFHWSRRTSNSGARFCLFGKTTERKGASGGGRTRDESETDIQAWKRTTATATATATTTTISGPLSLASTSARLAWSVLISPCLCTNHTHYMRASRPARLASSAAGEVNGRWTGGSEPLLRFCCSLASSRFPRLERRHATSTRLLAGRPAFRVSGIILFDCWLHEERLA